MMHSLAKKISDFRAWIVSAAFLSAVGWIVGSSKPFEACIEKEYREAAAENLEKGISEVAGSFAVYRDCLGHFTHDNAEAIIASFTILIALATIFLWAATRDLVRGADKTAERQLRAYVAVTPLSIKRLALNRSHIVFDARNAGQTPAYQGTQSALIEIFPYPLPPNFTFPTLTFDNDPSVFTIHASDPPNSHNCMASSTRVFEAEEMREACTQSSGKRIYVFGIVKYVDVFKRDRTTKFCYCIFPLEGFGVGPGKNVTSFGFEATSQHNSAT